jgi:transposase
MAYLALSDSQWDELKDIFPVNTFGRPQKHSNRRIFEALRYLLHTGCRWSEIPKNFPPKSTVFLRFQKWAREGVFTKLKRHLRRDLPETGLYFLDSTIKSAKKGRIRRAGRKNKRHENKPHCG